MPVAGLARPNLPMSVRCSGLDHMAIGSRFCQDLGVDLEDLRLAVYRSFAQVGRSVGLSGTFWGL